MCREHLNRERERERKRIYIYIYIYTVSYVETLHNLIDTKKINK